MSEVAGPCACPSFTDGMVLCGCTWLVGRNNLAYFLPSMPLDVIDDGNLTWSPLASLREDAKVTLAKVGAILVGHLASPPKINAKIVDVEEMGQ